MLEIFLINTTALSPNWADKIAPNLPIEVSNELVSESYLAKGKPYESDYSREVEQQRRRHEENFRHRDQRYYRDEDRRRRTDEEDRRERDDDYRRDRRQRDRDYDRSRSRSSFEELEAEKNRLERRLEVLERRLLESN